MNKKIINTSLIIFIIMFIICLTIFSKQQKAKTETEKVFTSSLYSWNIETILEDKSKFYRILEDYKVVTLYQDFTKEYLKEFDDSFIKDMNERGITVYHLGGDPAWGVEDGYKKIKKEIDRIITYNKEVQNKIKGIVLDIEPYTSEKEEKFDVFNFQIYTEQMEKAYNYTQENNLELILTIPYWLNTIDENLLEKLIQNSDGISVMNYKINKTSSKIKEEVEFAKKYNKKIDSIYEIEYGKEGYFKTYKDILTDFNILKENNPYSKLSISYHHYGSIK